MNLPVEKIFTAYVLTGHRKVQKMVNYETFSMYVVSEITQQLEDCVPWIIPSYLLHKLVHQNLGLMQ